jgi:23S rRNA (uracil1939-C5)-methyltransferase
VTLRPGALVRLDVERPAVGGRMIARADGRIVLVRGAIPGERVEARIERVQRQVAWADTVQVLTASPDRVEVAPGLTCGGQLLAHVSAARQRTLKGEMLADALRRIGKIVVDRPIDVLTGPADGYRTRARLHLRDGAVGFFDEGSHRLCDVAPARQLSATSVDVVQRLAAALVAVAPGLDAEIEWAEDAAGTARVAHLTVARGGDLTGVTTLATVDGLDGCSAAVAGDPDAPRQRLWGELRVVDRVLVGSAEASIAHAARAFFQGNRYLLQVLVDEVLSGIDGPVLDLYAGVGLFAVCAAVAGHRVTAVEGDAVAAADLADNAARASAVTAVHAAVEAHLAGPRQDVRTVVVDPPRTGLSHDALAGVLAWRPARIVYVSCDPATLARDLRGCLAAGYRLDGLRGVDLFPRTGHVEAVVRLAC